MEAALEVMSHPLAIAGLLALVYLACVSYVHFRGKERLKFERQLTEHSGLFSPFNTLIYLCSAVPRDPILPAKDFPQLKKLKDEWRTIRAEALALHDEGKIDYNADQQDLTFLSFKKLGWKRFHMKWYGDFLPSAAQRCPRTVELLKSVPGINAAAFTLLPPGSKLGRHRDPFASSLRYHLGLACPKQPGCSIWIDGLEHTWKDGEDLVFDETYVHWAANKTDEPRLILFVDFTRPLRFAPVRWFNQFLIDHVYRITASHNEKDEGRGLLNRITPIFFWSKHFFRGIKKRTNRKLYYAGKYALFLLLAWLVARQLAG